MDETANYPIVYSINQVPAGQTRKSLVRERCHVLCVEKKKEKTFILLRPSSLCVPRTSLLTARLFYHPDEAYAYDFNCLMNNFIQPNFCVKHMLE